MNNERLQWFKSKIGQRLYRNDNGCACDICHHILEKGILIHDEFQAEYCYDTECEYNAEGTPMRYFDSKEQVAEWLSTLKAEGRGTDPHSDFSET